MPRCHTSCLTGSYYLVLIYLGSAQQQHILDDFPNVYLEGAILGYICDTASDEQEDGISELWLRSCHGQSSIAQEQEALFEIVYPSA